jgi:hypothetical protein
LKKSVASFIIAVLALLVAAPANAAGPSKGPLASVAVVQCTINLASFPNPVKTPNPTNCNGFAIGVFAGFQANGPGGVVVGVAAGAPVSISAQYTEPCVAGALGNSNGVGNVTGLTAANVTKGGVLQPIDPAAKASIPYSWTRVGVVAVITVGKLNPLVDPKKGINSTLTWSTGNASDAVGGLGLGVLIPTGIPDPVNCPGGPLTVQIVAALAGL